MEVADLYMFITFKVLIPTLVRRTLTGYNHSNVLILTSRGVGKKSSRRTDSLNLRDNKGKEIGIILFF
jgi:hypothetical protein